MSETQTVAAESSPAEIEDVFRGETPSFDEFSRYRQTGELPDRFKPAGDADSASADQTQDSSEADADAEAETSAAPEAEKQQQEKPQPQKGKTAEDRIAQLEATIEKIRRGAGLERKAEVATVTEPQAPPEIPQTYQDWEKVFVPEKWIEEYAKQHPEASYERANAAMFSHMLNAREHFRSIEQQRESQARELNTKVSDARERYGEQFDEVVWPTLSTIVSDAQINPNVKEMLNDSDVVTDLLFTIGSDQKTLDDFLAMAKSNPGKALRYIATVENGIIEELSSNKASKRNENGQFASDESEKPTPAKPQTTAPKPPSPVGGGSSRAFDVSDESLSAEEWARKRTADLNKRGMG